MAFSTLELILPSGGVIIMNAGTNAHGGSPMIAHSVCLMLYVFDSAIIMA
jgi:hypothetical protein